MKPKAIFIATLMTVDAFLAGYAYGFNSRKILVIDPTLPAYKQQQKDPQPEKIIVKEPKLSDKSSKAAHKEERKHGKHSEQSRHHGARKSSGTGSQHK